LSSGSHFIFLSKSLVYIKKNLINTFEVKKVASYKKTVLLEKITSKQLTENAHIEFKSQWHQSFGQSISAIGNEDKGGWLIIGIDDKGVLLGKDSGWVKKQETQIENHISQYLEPNSTVQSISIETLDHKKFILIEIINPKSVVFWNGKPHKRVGTRTEEMNSGEKQELELKRPGLDFSSFNYQGKINFSLVLDFAKFVKNGNEYWNKLSADKVLSKLNINGKNISGILFGDFSFRIAHYNKESELTDQDEKQGLYSLLQKDFIQHIQSWTRTKGISLIPGSLSVKKEEPYPDAVLREVLVNAVAHSAFEKKERKVTVELYRNRIKVSNYCSAKATAFINKKFSQGHFSYNPFLMKILRKAKFSDEFGTGKNKIFKNMIESGRREPLFEYQKISDDYGIWSVTIYNEQPNENFLKLLERLKKLYENDTDKYKLSAALILWKDKSLKEIFTYIDEYHQKLIVEILSDSNSPFLYTTEYFGKKKTSVVKILLKRWVKVQLEGQESKVFSKAEESKFKEILQNYVYKDNRDGYITNKEARQLFGLSDSQSEIVQLSKLFQQWEKNGFMKKGEKRRDWKVKKKSKSPDLSIGDALDSIIAELDRHQKLDRD